MSVQAGIWNFDERPVDSTRIERYSRRLAKYGPDGENTFFAGPIGMLYRPFHTTSDSRLERQPHISPMGNVITWDGRLDNREELAAQLAERPSLMMTDVDVVSAAFDRWGLDCFVKFIGDWAFAGWNAKERTLTLAIDYMAIKHLYYYVKPDSIVWCSDLETLVLQSGDQFDLDDEYVAGYLASNPSPGHTPYLQIRSVEPGHVVRIHARHAASRAHFQFNPRVKIRYKTDAEYEEHFRHVFRQAVRRRLRADSPILAELSGGLDSSSIVCMADDILAREGAEAPGLDTVSFYDLSEPASDDLHYLKKIEEHRDKIGHHFDVCSYRNSLVVSPASFVAMPGSMGGDKKHAHEYAQMRQTGTFKVTLSGIGGDEMLGGVPDPRSQLADLLLSGRLIAFAKQTIAWSLIKRKPWIHLALTALRECASPTIRARMVKQGKVPEWLDSGFARRYGISLRQLGPRQNFGYWMPTRKESARTVVILSQQMACGIAHDTDAEERRYPYLDRCLVEFLLAIPAEQILRPGERRSLMRRALGGLLPDEVLHRRTKAVAVRRPLRAIENDWNQIEPIVDSSLAAQFGYVNKNRFHEALVAAKNGQAPQLVRLMRMLSLELWLRDVTQRGLIGNSQLFPEPWRLPLHSETNSTSNAVVR